MVKCPLSHGESAMGQFPAQAQGAGAFCRALCGHVRSIGTGPRNLCLIQASPHHVRLLDPGSPGSQFRKCCLSHVDVGNRNGNSSAKIEKRTAEKIGWHAAEMEAKAGVEAKAAAVLVLHGNVKVAGRRPGDWTRAHPPGRARGVGS